MRRDIRARALLPLIAILALLALPSAAQDTSRLPRIGMLFSSPRGEPPHMEHFYRGLRELGHVEGRHVVIERRFSDSEERLTQLAAELVANKVDVLLAAGPAATRAARAATATVPIVMSTMDPVEQGLVASLARPGGNLTGWCILSPESGEKQLALLKDVVPGISRVAVIANPKVPAHALRMQNLARSARALGIQLQTVEVAHAEALGPAFEAMVQARAEAFFVVPEPALIDGLRDRIVALAAQHRLPGIYHWKIFTVAGGLMSYGPSLPVLVRLWADYVHRILKGANPAELPIETPRTYELVLNLRTARDLGITFPARLVVLADDVIQ